VRSYEQCLEISGYTPYEWQLDVGKAILLSTNVTVIAPTGAGKTIPFVLPLLLDNADGGMVLIISPLKELQSDQVRIR
jgi:superfamily II DNA helicase RecQ